MTDCALLIPKGGRIVSPNLWLARCLASHRLRGYADELLFKTTGTSEVSSGSRTRGETKHAYARRQGGMLHLFTYGGGAGASTCCRVVSTAG